MSMKPTDRDATLNETIVRQFITEVWSRGNVERVSEFVASEYVAHALQSKVDIIGIESPRVYRRQKLMRGLCHGETEQVFRGS